MPARFGEGAGKLETTVPGVNPEIFSSLPIFRRPALSMDHADKSGGTGSRSAFQGDADLDAMATVAGKVTPINLPPWNGFSPG